MERRDCDRAFIAVLEAGSFARAAQHLGISAGQASKLVSKLEQDLGVQLLNRTARALAPTRLAWVLSSASSRCSMNSMPSMPRSGTPQARRRDACGCPCRCRSDRTTHAGADRLRSGIPKIHLDIRFSDRVVAVVDEGFDIVVRIGKPADSSLIARKLCDVRVVIVASPAYIASHGEPATSADLARHACIIDTNFQEPLVWRFRARELSKSTSVAVTGKLQFPTRTPASRRHRPASASPACQVFSPVPLWVRRRPATAARL